MAKGQMRSNKEKKKPKADKNLKKGGAAPSAVLVRQDARRARAQQEELHPGSGQPAGRAARRLGVGHDCTRLAGMAPRPCALRRSRVARGAAAAVMQMRPDTGGIGSAACFRALHDADACDGRPTPALAAEMRPPSQRIVRDAFFRKRDNDRTISSTSLFFTPFAAADREIREIIDTFDLARAGATSRSAH